MFVDTGLVRKCTRQTPAKLAIRHRRRCCSRPWRRPLANDGADREAGFRMTLYRDWEWELPLALEEYGRSIAFHLDADDLETLFGVGWAPQGEPQGGEEAGRVKRAHDHPARESSGALAADHGDSQEPVGAPTTPKQTDRGLAISEGSAAPSEDREKSATARNHRPHSQRPEGGKSTGLRRHTRGDHRGTGAQGCAQATRHRRSRRGRRETSAQASSAATSC